MKSISVNQEKMKIIHERSDFRNFPDDAIILATFFWGRWAISGFLERPNSPTVLGVRFQSASIRPRFLDVGN